MTKGLPNIKKKRVRNTFITIILIFFIGTVSLKYYYEEQLKPIAYDNIEEVYVEIPKGSSTSTIAKILFDNKLIRNEFIFRLVSKLEENDGKYKAGKYVLNNGLSQNEIMDKLIKGGESKESVRFTIPEGFELRQIADRLAENGLINKDRFLELCSKSSNFSSDYEFLKDVPSNNSLEGFLYPDTYEIYVDANEEDIIRKMLDRFESLYSDEIISKAKELDMNVNQVTTLASIIERECMLDEERTLISSVFHNRIDMNKKLESCATIQFILGERKENLSTKDTQIESAYNTYLHEGLPPGPIASPGIKSISAAVNPENSDYLFFVSNGDGSHTFSITYAEHLKAKNANGN